MRLFAVLIGLLASMPLPAMEVGGRIKFDALGYDAGPDTPEDALGYATSHETTAQLRLRMTHGVGPWSMEAALQLDMRHGSTVERDHALVAAYPALEYDPNTSYWDLESIGVDGGATQSTQRLDRFNLAYAGRAFVARMGRQALTWGAGLVFHPMDLVNPFQPVATDTAYKRGTDMLYAQWLLSDGSDIQFASVPRKRRDSADPDAGKSTHALFANVAGNSVQWNLLVAKDRADDVFGVGVSGALGGAAWNLETVATRLEGDATKTSLLANVNQASTWLRRNATLFAEYYHNGFGERGNEYTLAELNAALTMRIERSQQFVTGTDYLALGATWEQTPLLQWTPTLIANLRDHSVLIDIQATHSLSNDSAIKAGVRVPVGDQGTEFGGLELVPGSGMYLARSTQVFVRWEFFF